MLGCQPERLGLDSMTANVSFTNFLLLIFYALVMGAAQIIFSNAANQIKAAIPVSGILFSAVSSYWLYLGVAIYIFATVFWLYMLTRVDIRFAYPVASTAVIFSALFQSLYTNSFPSFSYWIGVVIILAGLGLINYG